VVVPLARFAELFMAFARSTLWTALAFSLLVLGSVDAAPKRSWDGTWSGKWGDQDAQATSVTIVHNKVVSYSYQGVSSPVAASKVTPTTVTYGDQGVTVVLKRTGDNTASASLHSPQGDATAELTRD
jgi:hypothetical protein